jgi:hypothetical protein
MTALAIVPSPAVTAGPLYAIEEYLAALVETAELVPADQEQEFRAEFESALSTAVEKRDRVGQFMVHLEQQIDFAKFEIERLRQRRTLYEHALERLERYVIGTIEHLGRDGRGKYCRLEGKTVTFSVRACPPSVEVTDEPAVPAEYKALTLKLPETLWEQLLDTIDVDQRAEVLAEVRNPEVSVDKRSVKAAIEAGRKVPGAGLVTVTAGAAEELRMKPARNPQYLRWIRTLPCAACGTTRHVEAAHTGPRGLSQKSPDTSAIPLCPRHHRTGDDSYHKLGPRKFSEVHQLDIPALVARLSAKPFIRVESGAFVGSLRGEEYILGPAQIGIARAVRKMTDIRREALMEVA